MDSAQHIKIALLMFVSLHVFRPEDQMRDPVRRDIKIYVQCLSNAPRITYLLLSSNAWELIFHNVYIDFPIYFSKVRHRLS